MPCYLVEWYQPDLIEDRFSVALERLDACVTTMASEGTPVRVLHTVTVPGDQVVFVAIAAGSETIVAELCRRAGVAAERVSAAISTELAVRQDS